MTRAAWRKILEVDSDARFCASTCNQLAATFRCDPWGRSPISGRGTESESGGHPVQKVGAYLKLEYANKDEADAARIILAKGEAVHKAASLPLLFAISEAMSPSRTATPQPLMTRAAWRKILEVDRDDGAQMVTARLSVQLPARLVGGVGRGCAIS